MKKLLFLFIFIILSSSSLAWFPEPHAYFTIKALKEVNSPIADYCKDREAQVVFGNAGSDVPVIHYLEGGKKLESYKGTHSRSFNAKCFEIAGNDADLKCVCYGNSFHLVQDFSSHYEFVPNFITKFFTSNVFGHPIIERQHADQLLARILREKDPSITIDELKYKSVHSLDLLYEDKKYIELFNKASGLDMTSDFVIVDAALKGERWQSVVYGKEIGLPPFYWYISISILVAGLIWMGLTIYIGRNGWKYLSYFIAILIITLGVALSASLVTNKSWIWFNSMASVVGKYIDIGDSTQITNQVLQDTKNFLLTEQLNAHGNLIEDAAGLDYVDQFNILHKGTLNTAETKYKFISYPLIMLILSAFTIWLFVKMSKKK